MPCPFKGRLIRRNGSDPDPIGTNCLTNSRASCEEPSAVFSGYYGSCQNEQRGLRPFGVHSPTMPRMQLRLTPRGHLLLEEANDAPTLDDNSGGTAGRGLWPWHRVWAVAAWSGRGRPILAARLRLVARFRRTLCGGGLSSRVGWGRRGAVRRNPVRHCPAGRGRTRHVRPDGPDDAGGGIPDRRYPAWAVGRSWHRACHGIHRSRN